MTALLPRQADNSYRGSRIAIGVFVTLLLLRIIMSVNSIVNGREVASTADGIPLDTYPPPAAQTIVTMFALLALANLVTALIGVVVLVRYRSLIPLFFVIFLLHHVGRRLILGWLEIERTGSSPGSIINLGLLALTVVGLALSLWPRDRGRASGETRA